jgi:hypothetical protein
MTVWHCRPWFGLARSGSALHTQILDNLTYLNAKFKEKPRLVFK